MDLVIDANIFAAYYQASVLGKDTSIEGDPVAVFNRLGNGDTAFLDESEMILGEWRAQASGDPEWFDEWVASRLVEGHIYEIAIDTCMVLLRKLWNECGLPRQSRDKWYIRTAHTQSQNAKLVTVVVTEDVDFFEPAAKADAKKRKKHLRSGNGKVARALRKHHVDPRTVCQHLVQEGA